MHFSFSAFPSRGYGLVWLEWVLTHLIEAPEVHLSVRFDLSWSPIPNYATLAVKSSAAALPEIFITRETTAVTPKFNASAGNAAYTP
jgi:hypothetical protein